MEGLFLQDNMRDFCSIIQKPATSMDEVLQNVGKATGLIAQDMHLGYVSLLLSVPATALRNKIDNAEYVVYDSKEEYTQAHRFEFRTGDGGTAEIRFHSLKGHDWNEKELEEVKLICYMMYGAFRQVMLEGLLRRSIATDMAVAIPNINGYMQYAGMLLAKGALRAYHAIYFNIQNFKYVNQVLSHTAADEVMKKYAAHVSGSTDKDEIVARLGGDNFVALIKNENVDSFIKTILNVSIEYQVENDDKKFVFGATIGVSDMEGVMDPGQMMLRSSVAYQTARQNNSRLVYYNDSLMEKIMHEKGVMTEFYKALEAQEFVVYYQPKVDTYTKKLYGAEALVRWKQADGNLKPPMEFIPVLEKNGSICKLDFYVLDKTCQLLSELIGEGITVKPISVNFSRKHMFNPQLAKDIIGIVDKYALEHSLIEIEFTESEDFRDYIVMSKVIDELKDQGISTSIDDFGTGYSSLNMLKMTSVDTLKIDKSFIPTEEYYGSNSKECIMFEYIAKLARGLGFKTISEGVETSEQYNYLATVGCDIIQGYYFDRPLPPEVFVERLKEPDYYIKK